MIKSYRIQRPIRDLQSLRQEKQLLRQHIAKGDDDLRDRVHNLPAVAALRTAQQVGSFFVQTTGGRAVSSLLGGGLKSKGFWKSLMKAAVVFAGTELVKRFARKQENQEDEEEDEGMGAPVPDERIPDLSE